MKSSLGTFKIESGKVTISDPCYEKGTWCMGETDALSGDWKASINAKTLEGWGERVATLLVEHATAKPVGKWEKLSIDCGVDSGQMSIVDSQFYRQDSEAEGRDLTGWKATAGHRFYSACCVLTCDEAKGRYTGGVLPHGAVSCSGVGDGSYTAYVKKDKAGNVVAIKVRFI